MALEKSENRPVIITGSQRSGTSVVAGILFHLGVYLGQWFLKKDIHNPTGYFEDVSFGNLDEARYRGEISKTQWKKSVSDLIDKRAHEQVYGFQRWGWKNPSSALYLEDYLAFSPDIIWCERDKNETIRSMQSMHWPDALAQYEEKQRVKQTIGDVFEINFTSLQENTAYEVGRMAGFLGLTPSKKKQDRALNHLITPPNRFEQETEHYTTYL